MSGGVFCVKHGEFPEISSFRDTSRKQRRAGCFLGREGGAAEKDLQKTEKTGRRILTSEDKHDKIKMQSASRKNGGWTAMQDLLN